MAKVYAYARVSTDKQDHDTQMNAIERYKYDELVLEKMSGKNYDRPKWKALYEKLEKGDTVMVARMDRLGRNFKESMLLIEEFKVRGIYIRVIDLGVDTEISSGNSMTAGLTNMLLMIVSQFAEMERDLILERTSAGRKRALENGVKFGPKFKNQKSYQKAIEMYLEGQHTVKQCVDAFDGLNETSFYRKLKKYKEENGLV